MNGYDAGAPTGGPPPSSTPQLLVEEWRAQCQRDFTNLLDAIRVIQVVAFFIDFS